MSIETESRHCFNGSAAAGCAAGPLISSIALMPESTTYFSVASPL